MSLPNALWALAMLDGSRPKRAGPCQSPVPDGHWPFYMAQGIEGLAEKSPCDPS